MKRRIILVIIGGVISFGVTLCCAAGYDPASSYNLTIDEAIGLAYKNNFDIQIQSQEISAAQAAIQGARSEFLPKLNAQAGFTHTDSVLKLDMPQAKKDMGIFTGYKNDNQAGLTLDQTIYNGGANIANLRQKQVTLRIQEETLRARKLDTEFEVKRLFYGLLLAHETERIAQNLLDQAKSHYEEVKNKYEQGTASRFDLLQSKVQVSKLAPELINAKNAVELIDAELKKLLGLKIQATLMIKDSLAYNEIEIKESEFLKTAYLEKPEMTLMALGVDVKKWLIEMAKAGHKPQINAQLGYAYQSNDVGDLVNRRHNNWDAGVSLSIPIFDGFSTKAKVDEAKARYTQAKLEKEDLGEQIAVDIRKACLDLVKSQAVILSQKDTIDEAQEALKISEVRYDNGEGTNLDVIDAQVSLSQVEENLSQGIYDYIMAEAYLSRTMGRSSVKEIRNEKTY
ncbi:MAG TPA: TolC family protein [Candidatus Omnitrophota bacterium]|nr:TolC family protein [Candidatus Omnitrophota bacterium]HPT06677.1 TolC family protein [Candidatus Omnitrophota bacterium]